MDFKNFYLMTKILFYTPPNANIQKNFKIAQPELKCINLKIIKKKRYMPLLICYDEKLYI